MKEATGDMTMTIVVIVGIIAVLTLGATVIWPTISEKITEETDKINSDDVQIETGYVEVVDNYYNI